jgi:hypothetical protein
MITYGSATDGGGTDDDLWEDGASATVSAASGPSTPLRRSTGIASSRTNHSQRCPGMNEKTGDLLGTPTPFTISTTSLRSQRFGTILPAKLYIGARST